MSTAELLPPHENGHPPVRLTTTGATLVDMSDPQQPPVPSSAQPTPQAPATPHLPAEPQYPAGTHDLGATLSTAAHQAPPAAPGAPQAYPTAPPQAYPTAPPPGYPTASPAAQAFTPSAPGYPAPYAAPAQARGGNPLGRTAFVIAVATFAINLIASLARPLVYSGTGGYEFMLAIDNGIGFFSFFGYALALVLGLIAARRAASQLLTGIAIGIAGVGVVGVAFTGVIMVALRYF